MSFLSRLINRKKNHKFVEQSYEIIDRKLWNRFLSDPKFPYLVSFPRTGSHWLRNVMELYFEKPALLRVFYYENPDDFTCYHIHDENLNFVKEEDRRIIYLYRNPVDTVFSQMNYYAEELGNEERVKYWADLYGQHLKKWLIDLNTENQVVLSYDSLRDDFHKEFKKIVVFLGYKFDSKKLDKVLDLVSKEKIKKKVSDDKNVIKNSEGYKERRAEFVERNKDLVWDCVLNQDIKLKGYF